MSTQSAYRLVLFVMLLGGMLVTAPANRMATAAADSGPMGAAAANVQRNNSYDDLVALFFEFRAARDSTNDAGVPDYSAGAIAERYQELQVFRQRLAAFDIDAWELWQQVDYHVVRGEMNAVEFHHRVHKPWARDPGFYSIRGGDAGASISTLR